MVHKSKTKTYFLLIQDLLDIGEKFDRLQMERMALEDPDSLPFYNAKKSSLKALKKAPIIRPGLAPNRAK